MEIIYNKESLSYGGNSLEDSYRLNENSFITNGDLYVIQHPFIISKEILKYQKNENFKYKIEETIKRISNKTKIRGVLNEMPPEFDNEDMLKNTKKFINMMDEQVIFIPGNGIANKDWIEKASIELKPIFPTPKIHYYKHWRENKSFLDFEYEFNKLKEEIRENQIIFAKSVGAVLCIKLIKENLIKPRKCIFLGLPVSWSMNNELDIKEWINDYSTPTLFIQNDEDPFCNANELRELFKESNVRNYKLEESEGNNHDYKDYKLIREKILSFLEI
ncbi:MAG: alpha/beta family hydrolase [Minisyncoccales bacterium]